MSGRVLVQREAEDTESKAKVKTCRGRGQLTDPEVTGVAGFTKRDV